MRDARRASGLISVLLLLSAGCGTSGSSSAHVLPETPLQGSGDSDALVFEEPVRSDTLVPEDEAPSTAIRSATPYPTPASMAGALAPPHASTVAIPDDVDGSTTLVIPVNTIALHAAARNSAFYEFGDEVFTWNGNRQIVILSVPADHQALHRMSERLGSGQGTVEDTPGTRSWVQECARRLSAEALGATDAVFGRVSAQSVYSCLGGLTQLAELLTQYWWTEEGVSCLAAAAIEHARLGDAGVRPLAVCPSIGYSPAEPRFPGWLAERCAEIAASHPNPKFPIDPEGIYPAGVPLPSCWAPMVDIIETHAAENTDRGLPDSPHACYHAFLGYVWARQTGRESRSPSDQAIGCHYLAFEAQP